MSFSVSNLSEEEYSLYKECKKLSDKIGYSKNFVHKRLHRGGNLKELYNELQNTPIKIKEIKYDKLDSVDKEIISVLKKVACKNNIGLAELKNRVSNIINSDNLEELIVADINKVRYKDSRKAGNNLKAKCNKLGISYKAVYRYKLRNAGYGWSDNEAIKKYTSRPKTLSQLCKEFKLEYRTVRDYKNHNSISNEEAIVHFIPNAYINNIGVVVIK